MKHTTNAGDWIRPCYDASLIVCYLPVFTPAKISDQSFKVISVTEAGCRIKKHWFSQSKYVHKWIRCKP